MEILISIFFSIFPMFIMGLIVFIVIRKHMKEITELVQTFDSRILLAAENLYERFGLENGGDILKQVFSVSLAAQGLSCSVWDPVPRLGFEPRPSALGAPFLATGPPGNSCSQSSVYR